MSRRKLVDTTRDAVARRGHATLDREFEAALARDKDQARVAHISIDDGASSLCGARITGRQPATNGRCAVCLELVTLNRWASR